MFTGFRKRVRTFRSRPEAAASPGFYSMLYAAVGPLLLKYQQSLTRLAGEAPRSDLLSLSQLGSDPQCSLFA
jgi:hypothetical protein